MGRGVIYIMFKMFRNGRAGDKLSESDEMWKYLRPKFALLTIVDNAYTLTSFNGAQETRVSKGGPEQEMRIRSRS